MTLAYLVKRSLSVIELFCSVLVFAGPVSAQEPNIENPPEGLSQHKQPQDSPPVVQPAAAHPREPSHQHSVVETARQPDQHHPERSV